MAHFIKDSQGSDYCNSAINIDLVESIIKDDSLKSESIFSIRFKGLDYLIGEGIWYFDMEAKRDIEYSNITNNNFNK